MLLPVTVSINNGFAIPCSMEHQHMLINDKAHALPVGKYTVYCATCGEVIQPDYSCACPDGDEEGTE